MAENGNWPWYYWVGIFLIWLAAMYFWGITRDALRDIYGGNKPYEEWKKKEKRDGIWGRWERDCFGSLRFELRRLTPIYQKAIRFTAS